MATIRTFVVAVARSTLSERLPPRRARPPADTRALTHRHTLPLDFSYTTIIIDFGISIYGHELDETIDPVWAAANIPAHLPVQGNLDPLALLAGGEQMENAVRHILRTFEGRPHIFNLGHGILQQTPIEHVHALLTLVKQGV